MNILIFLSFIMHNLKHFIYLILLIYNYKVYEFFILDLKKHCLKLTNEI